jgi:hypothetical protein
VKRGKAECTGHHVQTFSPALSRNQSALGTYTHDATQTLARVFPVDVSEIAVPLSDMKEASTSFKVPLRH